MIDRQAKTPVQAVAAEPPDGGLEGIVERVEVDIGVDKLRLRRQRPLVGDIDGLAGFDAEGVAEAVVAVRFLNVQRIGIDVAVVPGRLRLPVDIKAVLAVPGQRAADAVAGGLDGTRTICLLYTSDAADE